MTLVNIQDNPIVAKVGTRLADATVISSELNSGSTVYYQIHNRVTAVRTSVNSDNDVSNTANVVAVNTTRLKIILPERTKFRVRTKQGNANWGSWVNFKTRDKRYQSPDNITQLTDNTDDTSMTTGIGVNNGGNRRIVVTNSAKAVTTIHDTLTTTNKGARVVNADNLYNDTTSIVIHDTLTAANKGARVVNDGTITYTNRGATINNS